MGRWELVGDGSAKFWEGAAEGSTVTVRYGRVGSEGRTQVKTLESAAAAQHHLAKAVAEKERKGYQEVAAEERPAAPGEPEQQEQQGVHFPDEEHFEMPAAWRRLVYPRRGGITRSVGKLRPEVRELLAARLREEASWIEEMLASPASDPQVTEAVRAHLRGGHNPLGAAALAHLTMHYQLPEGAFVDAWVLEHGLPFAAQAVVAYFDTEAHCKQSGMRRHDPRLTRLPADSTVGHWARPHFAERLRALLAVADDDTYTQAVAALADCRSDLRLRVVVSYLLPAEQAWVDECCAEPLPTDQDLRAMLLCSLNSPAQLEHFGGGKLDLAWNAWSMALVATLAEGTGKAFAPLLDEALDNAYGSDAVRTLAAAVADLPTDDAFRILLARAGDKQVRPQLLTAMRRYPVRALRLLGAAVDSGAPHAAMAQQLLAAHVLSHPELTAAVLSDLPAEVAARVEPLLTRADRVADAPAESLPALLVSPPWAKKRAPRKARVAGGLPAAPEPQVVWKAGERESWAATRSWYSTWRKSYDWADEIAALQQGRPVKDVREARLFVVCSEDLVRPLLTAFAPEDFWDGEAALRPVAARFGTDALPLLLRASARQPATLGPLLLPYLDTGVAGQVCDWLGRLKSADATARAWLGRHGVAAVPFLVPHAVGPAGVARRGAEQALRLLTAAHGSEAVLPAAAAYGQQAADIVEEALTADPLERALPARMPAVGAWADPALLPQILLKEGGALPADAVRNALTVLALSKPGDVYPGLDVLTGHCTGDSLAAFAWGVFEQWRLAGMPAKESWALHALGWLGDDETVRRLTPILRAWPGEGAHHRAVEGLNVLATIGTDVALLHLHGVAQRVPFKALKVRAQEKIAEVAEGLGLTGEQLGDRLVPDFGLDANGSTVIDYGSRRFTVGFDEQLRPYVLDEDGKRRKDLPVPGARDDAQLAPTERKRFSALKKDVRTVAADQVRRLEAAMVDCRGWTAGEFHELFTSHPLLWHMVRRLVWLCEADGTTTAFRVAEDRTLADVEDDAFTLPDGAQVRIAHPLHLGGDVAAWSELFADYAILQPFSQLGRPVFALTPEEAASHRLARFENATVPVGRLLGLTKRGWQRGEPQDAGVERWFYRPIDDGHCLVIDLDEGIAVGAHDIFPDQTFRAVWLDESPGDYWARRDYPLRLGSLDPVMASELLADLTEVTAK